ncbi:hypothetical protein Taro_014573, partial [Colocasia esculenta]|nr:hypothetical protein [Colocasia esculenta]
MHLSADVDRLAKGRRLGFPRDSYLCGSVDKQLESIDRHTFARSLLVMASHGRRGAQAWEHEPRQEEKGEQQALAPHGPMVLPTPPLVDFSVFMQGLVQAMQMQAQTQAALQTQLQAQVLHDSPIITQRQMPQKLISQPTNPNVPPSRTVDYLRKSRFQKNLFTPPLGTTFSCKGSVDTTISGVDTMAQSKDRNVKKRSTSVDTSPGQVDTREPSQKAYFAVWDMVSTLNHLKSTLETSPRELICQSGT